MTLLVFLVAIVAVGTGFVAGRWGVGKMTGGVPGVRAALSTLSGSPYEEPGPRFARAGAGTVGWYVATALLGAAAFLAGGGHTVDETSMRVTVADGGPAALAGIRSGDKILEVGGTPTRDWDTLKRTVGQAGEGPMKVTVEREGERMVFEPTPRGNPPRILVSPPVVRNDVGIGRALVLGATLPFEVVSTTAKGLLAILSGSERPEVGGLGPVAIVAEARAARQDSLANAFKLLAAMMAYFLPMVAFASALAAIRPNRRR